MNSEFGMTSERRKLLNSFLVDQLANNLRLDEVLMFLQARSLINENVIEVIMNEITPTMRRYQLVRQLQMRGNDAFLLFYESLIQTNQRELAAFFEFALSDDELEKCNRNNSMTNCANNRVEWATNFDDECNRNYLSSEPKLVNNGCIMPSKIAIERNEKYYKSFSCVKAKEPGGILTDLKVDFSDNPTEMFTFDLDSTYPNFSSPRGLALIINNRYFQTMPERLGTDVDEINFSNLLQQLGYAVSIYRNLPSWDLKQTMQEFARRPEHLSVHSSIICVLTHGEHGELFGVDDVGVSVLEFVSYLNAANCPALAHKPKLFFLQACRGQQYDRGFSHGDDRADGFLDRFFACTNPHSRDDTHPDQLIKTPIEADILISYATTPGYVSWRNSMRGSWFIQSICEIFAKFSKSHDILSMLTMVNKKVAEAYESSSGSYKQIPDHSSRLRRSFYFFPGVVKANSFDF